MIRTLDAAVFNAMANDPTIRPWLGGIGPLDLTGLVADPQNFALLTPQCDGGYLLIRRDLGLYEAHSLAYPSARGRPMLELARDGFRYMFTATDAIEIVSKCPDGNTAALRWAEIVGFEHLGWRDEAFDLNGSLVGCSFKSLTYQSWVKKDRRNKVDGQRFHAKLTEIKGDIHPEDASHDYWVGATIEGVRQGNVGKAVSLYSRWAAQMGYFQPTILSFNPPVVDQGDAVVTLLHGEPHFLSVVMPEGLHVPKTEATSGG